MILNSKLLLQSLRHKVTSFCPKSMCRQLASHWGGAGPGLNGNEIRCDVGISSCWGLEGAQSTSRSHPLIGGVCPFGMLRTASIGSVRLPEPCPCLLGLGMYRKESIHLAILLLFFISFFQVCLGLVGSVVVFSFNPRNEEKKNNIHCPEGHEGPRVVALSRGPARFFLAITGVLNFRKGPGWDRN